MTPQTTIPPRAWALMLLLGFIWGGSFLSNRVALAEVGVFSVVAFRVSGAALVMWGYIRLARIPLPKLRDWPALITMGLFNNAIPFTLIVWGQQHIDSGLASILNAATAIFGVLVAASVFPDERLTYRKSIGVALGFLGVATAIGLHNLAQVNLTSLAQLAVLGASVSYALSGAFARHALKTLAPATAAAGMMTASAAVMIPAALLHDGLPGLAYSAPTWAALAYLSLVASALAYFLFYRVLALAGAGNLSLVTLLVAPVAILLGALVLHEALAPQAYAGFALLALGLLIIDGRLLNRRPFRH